MNDTCSYNSTGPWNGESLHQHDDGSWWWYTETWTDEYGPYDTKELAEADLRKYCKEFLGG